MDTPRQRLALLMAGMPPNSSAPAREMTPWNPPTVDKLPPFQIPGMSSPGVAVASASPPSTQPRTIPAYAQPFTGLRNTPGNGELPPFQQPGSSLPFERYYMPPEVRQPQAAPSPAPMPQQAAPMPAMPQTQQVSGGQGFSGPEPMELAAQAQVDPRYLPEHWRGAFNNWQFPT